MTGLPSYSFNYVPYNCLIMPCYFQIGWYDFLANVIYLAFSRHRTFKFHKMPHTLLIRMSSLGHEPLICFIDDGNRMCAVPKVLYGGVEFQLSSGRLAYRKINRILILSQIPFLFFVSSLVVADNTFCDYEDTDLMLSLEIEALTEKPPCLLNYIGLTLHTLLLNKYGL